MQSVSGAQFSSITFLFALFTTEAVAEVFATIIIHFKFMCKPL